MSSLSLAMLALSRQSSQKRQIKKQSVFLPFCTRGTIRVCVFLVFSFRGPSARYSVFWCRIVAFILRVPSRPLLILSRFSELGTCNFVKHDEWDWSDPKTLLGVLSPPLSGGRPLLAVNRSSRGWPACCRQATPGKLGCGLPLRGHSGPGQSVRASVLLSRVLTEAGVTPAKNLRGPAPLAASPTQPVSEVWQGTCRTRCVQGTWGADTHARKLTTY